MSVMPLAHFRSDAAPLYDQDSEGTEVSQNEFRVNFGAMELRL